jgi:hypothetical protein
MDLEKVGKRRVEWSGDYGFGMKSYSKNWLGGGGGGEMNLLSDEKSVAYSTDDYRNFYEVISFVISFVLNV